MLNNVRRWIARKILQSRVPLSAVSILHGSALLNQTGGQAAVVIADNVNCSKCVITLDTVAVLRDASDSLGLSRGVSSVLPLKDGGFLVTSLNPNNGSPIYFDSRGRFRTFVGRHGRGPGEYRAARRLIPYRNDSIVVLDPGVALARLLSQSLQPGRRKLEETLARATDAIALPDGQLVVSTLVRDRDRLGHPLHIYSSEFQLIKSMGKPGGGFTPEQAHAQQRLLAASEGRTFWAAHRSRYIIEKWDTNGALLARFERRAAWFTPHEFEVPTQNPFPAWSVLLDIEEDGRERLWAVSTISDERWREAFGPARATRSGTAYYPLEDRHRYLDTIVELLDVRRGQVIARIRLDDAVGSFSVGRLLAIPKADGEGTRVILVRPQVHGAS